MASSRSSANPPAARSTPYRRATLTRLDEIGSDAELSGNVDLRQRLFTFLATIAEDLREAAGPGAEAVEGASPDPSALLDRALRGQAITVDVLAALEVVCFPEFVAGHPGERRIDFVRMAAGNRTPLAPCFTALMAAANQRGLTWAAPPSSGDRVPPPVSIPVTLKLAGNELKNFAAFLKSEWRANDWMWGRIDAVPTLVDLLITVEGMTAHLATAGTDEEAVQRVRELVVGASDPAWRNYLEDEVWVSYGPLVSAEVATLRAGEAGASLAAIRDAVVARRQWEILAEELALPTSAPGPGDDPAPPAPLAPDATASRVAAYTCGLETVTDPRETSHAELAAATGASCRRRHRRPPRSPDRRNGH